MKYKKLFLTILLSFFTQSYQFHDFRDEETPSKTQCQKLTAVEINSIVASAKINKNFIISLKDCYRNNRSLFAKLMKINPSYLKYAGEKIKSDRRLLEPFLLRYPKIFQHTAYNIRSDKIFIKKITTSYPHYLQYAATEIKDNKLFILKLINNNPQIFPYVSYRLKDDAEVAMIAVSQDGSMAEYVSQKLKNNKKIAVAAVKSNIKSVKFLSKKIQDDADIKKIVNGYNDKYLKDLPSFLKKNYGIVDKSISYKKGYRIINYKKLHPNQNLIDEIYKIKWIVKENIDSTFHYKIKSIKNNHFGWKNEFFKYEGLYETVSKFLSKNNIDENTISKLTLTSLWELDDRGNTVAFNLYMLRDLHDKYKDSNFINVVSFTAIAQKKQKDWIITKVQGIFDSDIYMQINFKNGHQKYQIWDLYQSDKDDKIKKIIFLVEGDNSEHFEIFAQQPSGHFALVFQGGGYK